MGIKFYCPNGHKLNVKSFLAGKKAICPKCNVKVLVPLESQRGAGAAQPAGDGPEGLSAQPAVEASSNLASNFDPLKVSATGPAQNMSDPIDEAPTAVWYVRPPSGGQYGPAAGPTMRSWLQEGRVSANALVWRDGWPEWRSAAAVFPVLGASPAGAPAAVATPVLPTAPQGAPWQGAIVHGHAPMEATAPMGHVAPLGHAVPMGQAAPMAMPVGQVVSALETPLAGYDAVGVDEEPLARRRKNRKKDTDLTLYVSGALVIMTIVLVVVLVVVLMKQQDTGETPTSSTPAAQSDKSAEAEEPDPAAAEKPAGGKKKSKRKAVEASAEDMKKDTMDSN